jgi:hypothetical protein
MPRARALTTRQPVMGPSWTLHAAGNSGPTCSHVHEAAASSTGSALNARRTAPARALRHRHRADGRRARPHLRRADHPSRSARTSASAWPSANTGGARDRRTRPHGARPLLARLGSPRGRAARPVSTCDWGAGVPGVHAAQPSHGGVPRGQSKGVHDLACSAARHQALPMQRAYFERAAHASLRDALRSAHATARRAPDRLVNQARGGVRSAARADVLEPGPMSHRCRGCRAR